MCKSNLIVSFVQLLLTYFKCPGSTNGVRYTILRRPKDLLNTNKVHDPDSELPT